MRDHDQQCEAEYVYEGYTDCGCVDRRGRDSHALTDNAERDLQRRTGNVNRLDRHIHNHRQNQVHYGSSAQHQVHSRIRRIIHRRHLLGILMTWAPQTLPQPEVPTP